LSNQIMKLAGENWQNYSNNKSDVTIYDKEKALGKASSVAQY
jgi:hypothetical protein